MSMLSGCAARQTTSGSLSGDAETQRLRFDPIEIQPGPPEEVALADLNPDELFAMGTAHFAAGEFEKSARAFGRLADVYPESANAASANYNAGLALERLSRFEEAGNRFAAVADARTGQGDALFAAFHLANCLYQLGDYARAADLLRQMVDRTDLERPERLQALVQHAVCQVELGHREEAEAEFRRALGFWNAYRNEEALDAYFPAQAQFFLGEIHRLRFEEVRLDPTIGEAALAEALEHKCQLLLSAQGHYLRAIRMSQSHWATLAGFRVGSLYETLYDEMMSAKLPDGLDEEAAAIYREELKKKLRVLVTKALPIYEQTLAAAERTGTNAPFVEKARQSLERLKIILVEEDEGEGEGEAGGATERKVE
jgi:tetratricopeptide (TPR) repeat protein